MASQWWNEHSVAVVTGGYRGIGLAVCRLLAQNGLLVILTARRQSAGIEACGALKEQGLQNVVFHELDVQSPESIAKFAEWLKAEYGGLDILINNAAVNGVIWNMTAAEELDFQLDDTEDVAVRKKLFEAGRDCIEINYYGVKRTIDALLPLFRPSSAGARVINLSSYMGKLEFLPNDSLRQQLSNPEILTQEFIEKTLRSFLDDLEGGRLAEHSWPEVLSAYTMTKMAVNAYTRVLARELESRPEGRKIYANAVHPGYVKTEMTKYAGKFTADESAEGVVWLALLAQEQPSGQFFYRKRPFGF